MKLIAQILAALFVVGLVVIVGRFVLAVIGVGAATLWHLWPVIVIGGAVWLIASKRR